MEGNLGRRWEKERRGIDRERDRERQRETERDRERERQGVRKAGRKKKKREQKVPVLPLGLEPRTTGLASAARHGVAATEWQVTGRGKQAILAFPGWLPGWPTNLRHINLKFATPPHLAPVAQWLER